MRFETWIVRAILVVGLLGVPGESPGQAGRPSYREPVQQGNPRRDAGGSCVYDKQGRVVFAPEGKRCPDATNHLSKSGDSESPIVAAYPPGLRPDLARLLGDHDHIAEEVARLQKAVAGRDEAGAMEAVDKIRTEITEHRAREEAFLQKIAPVADMP